MPRGSSAVTSSTEPGRKQRRGRKRPPARRSERGASTPGESRLRWLTRERLWLGGILALAFLLRSYRLMADYPIVGDEGIYLRWAEIIDHQGQWFISLLDGKQPFSYWIYALQRMLFDADPLWMGRMVSVLAGVGAAWGIYRIGMLAANPAVGLLAAFFYAIFPWAMMYDRLVYTEALVNFFGVMTVWSALACFRREPPEAKHDALAGLMLGLAFFNKSTALLFAFFPAVAGLWLARKNRLALARRLALIYAVAAVFPVVSYLFTPEAPMFETHDIVLHHSTFFVEPDALLENPLVRAPQNAGRFGEYLPYLVSTPAAVAMGLSLVYLLWRRPAAALVVASVTVLPLAVQIFVLTFFPTRYPYPWLWPWLMLAAMATGQLYDDLKAKLADRRALWAAGAAAGLLLAGPMAARAWLVLNNPKENISPHDSGYYFGTYSHAGFGVREAVDWFIAEARRNGPFLLLTDPIWSVPADAMFPYLNHKYGIRVHEAWWMQISGTHPVMPLGEVELMKSQYERVKGGKINFLEERRVFYITDTNYYTHQAVLVRQPAAQLVHSIDKGGGYALNIYRLK